MRHPAATTPNHHHQSSIQVFLALRPKKTTTSSIPSVSATMSVSTTRSAGELTAIVSDALIAIAYFAIPCQIFYFSRHIRLDGLRGSPMFIVWLFMAFILLCGMTHFFGVWLGGASTTMTVAKALTAAVSVATALVLVRLMPLVLNLPARLFVLEEELGLRIQNERLLQLENSNLHKLRSVTQSIRRSMTYQTICDVATVQLTNHFDLAGCFMFAVDAHHLNRATCVAEYAKVPHLRVASGAVLGEGFPDLTHLLKRSSSSRQRKSSSLSSSSSAAPMPHSSSTDPIHPPPDCIMDIEDEQQNSSTGNVRYCSQPPLMHVIGGTEMTAASTDHAHWVHLDPHLIECLTDPTLRHDHAMATPMNAPLSPNNGTATRDNMTANLSQDQLPSRRQRTDTIPTTTTTGTVPSLSSGSGTSLYQASAEGKRTIMLLLHEPDTVRTQGPVLADAVGQVEIALDQSVQIERDLGRRAQVSVLEREKREAEALNGMKTVFLATISHELRTPMNAIIGFVDLLLSQHELSRDMRDILEIVAVSSNSLLNLVNDILDLSKLEFHGNQFALEEAPISITDVVEQSIEVVYPVAERKGIQVAAVLNHAVDAVLGDKLRVRQVLVNLLSNAIKFTPNGCVSLTVTSAEPETYYVTAEGAKQRKQRILDFYAPRQASGSIPETVTTMATVGSVPSPPSMRIFFQVRDSGIGIAQDKIHLLFEKFQQLDATIARRFQGTGLGLAITSRLVELHRGRIIVDSVPGVGTLFTIMLCFPPNLDLTQQQGPASPGSSLFAAPSSPTKPSALQLTHLEGGVSLPSSAEVTPVNDVPVVLTGLRVGVISAPNVEMAALKSMLRRLQCIPIELLSVPAPPPTEPLSQVAATAAIRPAHSTAPLAYDVLIVNEPIATDAMTSDDYSALCKWARHLPVVGIAKLKAAVATGNNSLPSSPQAQSARSLKNDCACGGFNITKPVRLRVLESTLRTAIQEFRKPRPITVPSPHRDLNTPPPLTTNEITVDGGSSNTPLLTLNDKLLPTPSSSVEPHTLAPQSPSRPSRSASPTPNSSPISANIDPRYSHLKVLIVDDNNINQMVAVRTLRSIGVTNVNTANNGAEAVAYVEAHPDVDVVFMDVSMPVMDGLEATRAILANAAAKVVMFGVKPVLLGRRTSNSTAVSRSPSHSNLGVPGSIPPVFDGSDGIHGKGLPFICAMTASALPEERTTCLNTGMHDFVPKPIRRNDLLEVLGRYCVWRDARPVPTPAQEAAVAAALAAANGTTRLGPAAAGAVTQPSSLSPTAALVNGALPSPPAEGSRQPDPRAPSP
ncbi:hypothetical protein BCR44DRAFT_1525761 [Catenaria anguillulae PL171]|uniref:histidine kinase n=1 Tax=Catenaria anguillulae PL171 TaxID=765915 RepID=A0A1Y2HTX7_9FUNG|nr:hypothetical protein BCR44DRAFT_1525761 [Catenaria anguillulae PL171]